MDNLVTTTELQKRFGSTSATIIKKLECHGFSPVDIVVNSHHVWGWNQEAVAWLERHFRMLASQKITLEDYAKELGIDMKLFKEILYSLHITANIQTTRNPLIEEAVEKYKAQEKLNTDIENHPLVKDKNFFKLTYFPDAVPKCFEDIDENIV